MVVLDVKLDEKDVLLDADAAAASLSLPTTIGNEGRSVPVLLLLLLLLLVVDDNTAVFTDDAIGGGVVGVDVLLPNGCEDAIKVAVDTSANRCRCRNGCDTVSARIRFA